VTFGLLIIISVAVSALSQKRGRAAA
jgi:hypothetical protein